MKNLIFVLLVLSFGVKASAKDTYCIEKATVHTIQFYYGNLLKVDTSGPDYILMTQGCDDLSLAAYFELKSAAEGNLAICKYDVVLLQNQERQTYGTCLISEVLKEEP